MRSAGATFRGLRGALRSAAARSGDLAKIEAQLGEIQGRLTRTVRVQEELSQHVAALLRLATVGAVDAYPEALTARRFRLASQNEEDGVTFALLREIGSWTRKFVEIGAGNNGGNSGFLAAELGFDGLMIDGSDRKLGSLRSSLQGSGDITMLSTWVTAENVNELLAGNGFDTEVDVFSLDIDGNDYWVWKAMEACEPRIVILEYNAVFGPERAVTVPYDPAFVVSRDGPFRRSYYYGASLAALTALSREKGYRLVAVEPQGVNAFFLRSDVAPHVPACDPLRVFRINRKQRILVENGFDVWKEMAEKGRTVVDVAV